MDVRRRLWSSCSRAAARTRPPCTPTLLRWQAALSSRTGREGVAERLNKPSEKVRTHPQTSPHHPPHHSTPHHPPPLTTRLDLCPTRTPASYTIPTARLPPCAPPNSLSSTSPPLLAASCTAQHTARHLLRARRLLMLPSAGDAVSNLRRLQPRVQESEARPAAGRGVRLRLALRRGSPGRQPARQGPPREEPARHRPLHQGR